MNSNHTPGKWYAKHSSENDSKKHAFNIRSKHESFDLSIGVILNDIYAEANAQLIAAAPEMMAELKTNHDFLFALYSTINNGIFNKETAQQLIRDRMTKQLSIIESTKFHIAKY